MPTNGYHSQTDFIDDMLIHQKKGERITSQMSVITSQIRRVWEKGNGGSRKGGGAGAIFWQDL